jgi:hypothetical protein
LVQFLNGTDYKSKVVLLDCCDDWVVNIAMGGVLAKDELMSIIKKWLDENKDEAAERSVRKWQYLQRMLPKMYQCHEVIS